MVRPFAGGSRLSKRSLGVSRAAYASEENSELVFAEKKVCKGPIYGSLNSLSVRVLYNFSRAGGWLPGS